MTRSRSLTFLAGAALTALALAGCGGGPTIGVATGGLGDILVDSKDRTLYLFEKDTATGSACAGACASAWPPLRPSDEVTVGGGADVSLIATTGRSDGTTQLTYNGHPLYLYAGDARSGDVRGQGLTDFGARWYALSPDGEQVSTQPPDSGAGPSPTGGY